VGFKWKREAVRPDINGLTSLIRDFTSIHGRSWYRHKGVKPGYEYRVETLLFQILSLINKREALAVAYRYGFADGDVYKKYEEVGKLVERVDASQPISKTRARNLTINGLSHLNRIWFRREIGPMLVPNSDMNYEPMLSTFRNDRRLCAEIVTEVTLISDALIKYLG
jgi:hypothetical protein